MLIGIGNEFRQDDGVGIYIIRNLNLMDKTNVDCLENNGEITSLIQKWAPYREVVLFDAVQARTPPGTIYKLQAGKDKFPPDVTSISTHSFNLSTIIQLAIHLNKLPFSLLIYGIVGKDFGYSNQLSPEVQQAAQKIILEMEFLFNKENKSTHSQIMHPISRE